MVFCRLLREKSGVTYHAGNCEAGYVGTEPGILFRNLGIRPGRGRWWERRTKQSVGMDGGNVVTGSRPRNTARY